MDTNNATLPSKMRCLDLHGPFADKAGRDMWAAAFESPALCGPWSTTRWTAFLRSAPVFSAGAEVRVRVSSVDFGKGTGLVEVL